MNFQPLILALISAVSAKISIISPEKNETAKKAFDILFSKFDIDRVRGCGTNLSSKMAFSQASYRRCIKGLNTPKIFEKHLLDLKAEDFDAEYGIAFSGTMSDIIEKVSKELETTCSHLDPNAVDEAAYDEIIKENCQVNNYSDNDIDNNDIDFKKKKTIGPSFTLDALHMVFILVILVLVFGAAAIYYLNDRRSVKINRKLVNNLSEKI